MEIIKYLSAQVIFYIAAHFWAVGLFFVIVGALLLLLFRRDRTATVVLRAALIGVGAGLIVICVKFLLSTKVFEWF